ncbi:MAG: hypothetical protein O9290_12870, partial [Microcystis sp. LE19-41.2A]|uniref:hypothetical protein n=2 Tax=unclassified Microcystis TaxID=2643300 RepID=UPI0022C95AC0
MEITPFSQRSLDGEGAEMLLDFKKAHQQDLKAIAEILARISHQSPEKVEILLETMLKQLIEPKTPFYETATPTERAQAFRDWASSHDRGSALLSDYAVSRDSIFDILAAVKRTAIPKPHDLGFCFFPLRGSAPALTDLLCSGLMVALQTD